MNSGRKRAIVQSGTFFSARAAPALGFPFSRTTFVVIVEPAFAGRACCFDRAATSDCSKIRVHIAVKGKHAGGHEHDMRGDRAPSPMRNAFIASSNDNGRNWSPPRRVNSEVEAIQGEENGPKVAFNSNNRAYVVWSIPGGKGNKTHANIRFAMEDSKGSFTPARPLNEAKDTARFPIIEAMPNGNFLIAWIDRRIDQSEAAPSLFDETGRRRQGVDDELPNW